MANHSYKRFAEALQREHHTAWGSSAVPIRSSTASPTTGREFLSRWAEIHPTLRWDLEFDTQAFIVRAAKALRQRRGQAGAIQIAHARLDPDGAVVAWTSRCADATSSAWPDLLSILGRRTHLSRGTVAEILVRSGRLETVEDPEGLLVDAEAAIRGVGQALLGGELSIQRVMACWRLRNTDDHPHEGTRLELPGGFAVSTPLGTFRPNRAIWAPGKLHLSRPSSHTDAHD